jgi:SAM-dependent methyltransferase
MRTGRPAVNTDREPDGAAYFAAFVESLFPVGFPAATALGRHLGIDRSTGPVSVLDVGAGSGVWGIALAKQSPQVRMRAVDWPEVLEVTQKVARRHGVAERLTAVPGDFLAADFGQGHQVAVLGHILHSEGADRSRRLLAKVFAALAPGGTVAIQEFMPNDDRTGPALPLLFAVNMLVNTEHGDTYTFAELSAWLRESGFASVRLLDVPGPSPLVLANKPTS